MRVHGADAVARDARPYGAGAALAYCTLIGCLDGMLLAGYLTTYAAGDAWRRAGERADPAVYPRYRAAAFHAAELTGPEIFEHVLELLLRGLDRDTGSEAL